MKNIFEYIILIVIIAALAVIFGIQQNTKHKNANLPALPAFSAQDLTRIDVKTPTDELKFERVANGKWTLAPYGYPVEDRLSSIIEEALANFKLTALISESAEDYARYELDNARKIAVTAYTGDDMVLDMDLGAVVADNFRHNYVKMSGDPNVYHGRGNLRTFFDTNEFELREKQILSFDINDIDSITMNFGGVDRTVYSQTVKDVDGNDIKIWLGPDNVYIDSGLVASFLAFVKSTNVYEFLPQDYTNSGPTVFIIALWANNGASTHVLRVFEPDPEALAAAEEEYDVLFDAGSSDVISPFRLTYAQQSDILKHFDDIFKPLDDENGASSDQIIVENLPEE